MDFVKREDIAKNCLPGRVVQNAVGRNSAVASEKMTVSFCHYSAESGPMEPHNHAEESVVVLSCRDAYVKYGSAKDSLEYTVELHEGDLMHFPELEWHVFGYREGGLRRSRASKRGKHLPGGPDEPKEDKKRPARKLPRRALFLCCMLPSVRA